MDSDLGPKGARTIREVCRTEPDSLPNARVVTAPDSELDQHTTDDYRTTANVRERPGEQMRLPSGTARETTAPEDGDTHREATNVGAAVLAAGRYRNNTN